MKTEEASNYTQEQLINIVLTSIVNNKPILRGIIGDLKDRFQIVLDEEKLENFLSVVNVKVPGNSVIL